METVQNVLAYIGGICLVVSTVALIIAIITRKDE